LDGTISATYQTSGITATPGADYVETTNVVTFLPGEVFHTVPITILDDFLPEPNEYFAVTLRDPIGGVIGRQPVTTVEIVSDDTRISFASDTFVVNENAPGARANITIVREGISSVPVTVLVSTSDGTATANSDYTPISTQVTFAPDETVKVVGVPIVDDSAVEPDETVNLSLTLVSQSPEASIGTGSATLTIVDNDQAPGTIEFAGTAFAPEGAGSITLTLTRTGGQLGAVSVNYATEDGTATAPGDYTPRSGTVTFQQTDTAKTIVIPISQDSEIEGNENFFVRLSNPTGGAVLGLNSLGTAVIVDDDFGPGSLDDAFDVGSGAAGTVYAIKLQPDGKIVAGGGFTDFNNSGHPRLVRLLADGSIDPNFSSGGGPDGPVYAVDLADAGRIVIGGDFRAINSIDRLYYSRMTPSGALDPTMTASPGLNAFVRTLITQPDYNVVIGGAFTTPANRAGRVLVSGAFDVSFNTGSGADGNVLDARLQADGKVILGGAFTHFGGLPRGHVARLLSNGLIDPAFNTAVGADGDVNRVLPLPDGTTIVAGNFSKFNGVSAPRITALNSDGSVNTNYNFGGGPDDAVFALALQDDGKILIGGDFKNVDGNPRTRVARLLANGSVDDTFKPGLGPDGRVYDIEVQPDKQILIAGAFTNVNGFPRRGIARLNSALPAPKVLATTISGTDLSITFESKPGVTYNVEATTDIGNKNSWVIVGTPTATGATTQVSVPMDAPYRFFRITIPGP
jgi:uncharacterized delta-60 repeat protein